MRILFTLQNLLLSLCLLLCISTKQAQAKLNRASDTHEFLLENGLRLIVKVDNRAPTIVNMVWYKAGSVDEVNGTTGVAHALEHMMFKSTKMLKVGEFSKLIAEMGGVENAFTSNDYTAYYQRLDKKYLSRALALEADRMNNLTLSEEEFSKEIRVIMEERRWRTDDKPQSKTYEALMATAFQVSPIRYPVIGWMNDLENMTFKDTHDWYQRWYAPNNAIIVIVGDVNPDDVYQEVKKTFGHLKKRGLPERKPQTEPMQAGIRRVSVKAPAEQPYIILGYKVPHLQDIEKDSDVYALIVLSAILSGYDGARLQKNLVQSNPIATAVDSSYDFIARKDSLFMIDATPATGKTTDTLELAIKKELQNIAQSGVSSNELARVKNQWIASQVFQRDSIYSQAMQIGYMEMGGISHRNQPIIIEKIKAVTSEQVSAVAKKYFSDDQLTVATLEPLPLSEKKNVSAPPNLRH